MNEVMKNLIFANAIRREFFESLNEVFNNEDDFYFVKSDELEFSEFYHANSLYSFYYVHAIGELDEYTVKFRLDRISTSYNPLIGKVERKSNEIVLEVENTIHYNVSTIALILRGKRITIPKVQYIIKYFDQVTKL